MKLESTIQRLTTYTNTQNAHSQGWSIVPLLGDNNPDNGKSPAINWKNYQTTKPSIQQIDNWFNNKQARTAYGIVCGSVSNLCVIDIDDLSLVDKLKKKLPFIFDTYTVRTGNRGGLHLYFYVNFKVYSRHLKGIDIKGEGGYVVGPGSTINGRTWTCINDQSPRRLTQEQWGHILATLKQPKIVVRGTPAQCSQQQNANTYRGLYRNHIEDQGGRNNSLFMTACFMRNDGYDMDTCIQTLANCHANEPSWDKQAQESYGARYREALTTIRSAYKQPSFTKETNKDKQTTSRVPNSLREYLLQQPGGVAVLRTFEALLLVGTKSGTRLSIRKAVQLVKGIVGEHSVRIALAFTQEGQHLFPRLSPPRTPRNSEANADIQRDKEIELRAHTTTSQPVRLSGGKNRHTQTAAAIIMPSIRHLCRVLGLEYSHLSTALCREDLQSAKAYRQALHLDLIKRCPGQHSQSLLGTRIGVSERTIRSYNTQLPIHSQKMWYTTPLHLNNLSIVPQKADFGMYSGLGLSIGGHWLQDETGKRYPPFKEIVFKLWRDKHKVFYCQQTTSYYWVEEQHKPKFIFVETKQPALMPAQGTAQQSASVVLPIDKPQSKPWHKLPLPNPAQEKLAEDIHTHIAKISISTARKIVVKNDLNALRQVLQQVCYKIEQGAVGSPKSYFIQSVYNMRQSQEGWDVPTAFRQPLASWHNEQTAQQLHTAIPDINISNARRLVITYGMKETKTAIRRVLWLNEKGKVRNLAGFFIMAVRGVWREMNGGMDNLSIRTPRFRGESKRC